MKLPGPTEPQAVPVNGNGAKQRARSSDPKWDAFFEAMGRTGYVPVFNSFLEGIRDNPALLIHDRLLGLIMLRSWGEHSKYAVDEGGDPLWPAEMARRLGVDRRRMADALARLSAYGFLLIEGDRVYPLKQPTLCQEANLSGTYRTNSEEKAKVIGQWAGDDPELIPFVEDAALRSSRITSLLQELNQERLALNKIYRRAAKELAIRTGQTETAEAVERTGQNGEYVSDKIASTSWTNDERILNTNPKPQTRRRRSDTATREALAEAVGSYDDDAVHTLVKECERTRPDATDEEIAAKVREHIPKLRRADNPIGFLLTAVPKCFVGEPFERWRAERATQPPQPATPYDLERRRAEYEATIRDPNASERERGIARELLDGMPCD